MNRGWLMYVLPPAPAIAAVYLDLKWVVAIGLSLIVGLLFECTLRLEAGLPPRERRRD